MLRKLVIIASKGKSDPRAPVLRSRVEKLTSGVDTTSFEDVLGQIEENFGKIAVIVRNEAISADNLRKISQHKGSYPDFVATMELIPAAGATVHEQTMAEVMKPLPKRKEVVEYFDPSPFAEEDLKFALNKFCAAELGHRSLRRDVLGYWNRCRECFDDMMRIHGKETTKKYFYSYQTIRGKLSAEEISEAREQRSERKQRVDQFRRELIQQRYAVRAVEAKKRKEKWEKKKRK